MLDAPPGRARRGRRAADRRRRRGSRRATATRASSPPTSTSAPRLMPMRAQRLLELLGRRRRADDAIAAVGAEDAEARPAPRLAAGTRGTPAASLLLGRPRGSRPGRARRALASARRCPAPVAHDVGTTRTMRSSRERRTSGGARAGRPCSGRRSAAARRGRRRTPRARGRSRETAPRGPRSDASITCTSSRARSRCARNS